MNAGNSPGRRDRPRQAEQAPVAPRGWKMWIRADLGAAEEEMEPPGRGGGRGSSAAGTGAMGGEGWWGEGVPAPSLPHSCRIPAPFLPESLSSSLSESLPDSGLNPCPHPCPNPCPIPARILVRVLVLIPA